MHTKFDDAYWAAFDKVRALREEWEETLPLSEYHDRAVAHLKTLGPQAPGRAELLGALTWMYSVEAFEYFDLERAESFAREAVAIEGLSGIDPRVELVGLLFRRGKDEEALALARLCQKEPSLMTVDATTGTVLGDILEAEGQYTLALRSYNIELRDFDPAYDEPDFDQEECWTGRFRVRRILGRPDDTLDIAYMTFSPEKAEIIRRREEGAFDASSA